MSETPISLSEIERWLREDDPVQLEALWQRADDMRHAHVGEAVYLRGLLEISNHCCRQCAYCGVRAGNTSVTRYRMSADEILACAHMAARLEYGTLVIQSGEDFGATGDWVAELIRRIKTETGCAVTLSLGERREEEVRLWHAAGADRYLLRFETSNPAHFAVIHPKLPGGYEDRFETLRLLREVGYEVGSGMLIGFPGQTWADLAQDIWTLREQDFDMIGAGPYVPHPETPMGRDEARLRAPEGEQVPASDVSAYKVIALARILCPTANIPSTTAIATLNRASGRVSALQRGANIVMPNLTPAKYRRLYEIYPAKAGSTETPEESDRRAREQIASIGRAIGKGHGDSRHFTARVQ